MYMSALYPIEEPFEYTQRNRYLVESSMKVAKGPATRISVNNHGDLSLYRDVGCT